MIAEHMARVEAEQTVRDFETQLREHMARLGAKGGNIGGKRRLETMTPERRSEIALAAARKRWAKAKTAKKRQNASVETTVQNSTSSIDSCQHN